MIASNQLTNEQKVLKVKCESDFLFFMRYIYKENNRRNFIVAPHFVLLADFVMKIVKGEVKRGIINIPPRYGKTEMLVKEFIVKTKNRLKQTSSPKS